MKERIRNLYDRLFFTPKPFPSGNYHSTITLDDGTQARLHLRVEQDGLGILIINASTILHLNPTATEIAYHLIQNTPEEEAVKSMTKRYRVEESVLREDFSNFKIQLHTLISMPDLDPETFLDIERLELHSKQISAPLRLDCALTYQLSNGEANHFAPTERVVRNLDTEEWKSILSKAWDAGIPHVVFTGGEPTLRPDLPELIAHSENLGQVTGVITDGLRLTEKDYLHTLLQSGLDHLMLVLDPGEDQSWEAIRDVIPEDIFTTVHITVSPRIRQSAADLFIELKKIGVSSISLSIDSNDHRALLQEYRDRSAELGLALVYDLPVPYSINNPITIETEANEAKKEGAGRTWLYIEPDGDVIPGQGNPKVLGNFLTTPWEEIWLNASK